MASSRNGHADNTKIHNNIAAPIQYVNCIQIIWSNKSYIRPGLLHHSTTCIQLIWSNKSYIRPGLLYHSTTCIQLIIYTTWSPITIQLVVYNLSGAINHIYDLVSYTIQLLVYNLSDAINHIYDLVSYTIQLLVYNLSGAINHIYDLVSYTIQLLVYDLINYAIWLTIEHVDRKVVSEDKKLDEA